MTTNTRRVFSWSTTKTAEGFGFRVYQVISSNTPDANGHYAAFVDVKTGTAATRAQASGAAKRWAKFFRNGGVV